MTLKIGDLVIRQRIHGGVVFGKIVAIVGFNGLANMPRAHVYLYTNQSTRFFLIDFKYYDFIMTPRKY
jgi:hypothetical protein